jgi:hypothetical protein
MAGSCPSAARVSRFGSKPCVLVLGLGFCLCILPVHTFFGQDRGEPLVPLAASLRMSVASNVAQGCGGTILPSVIQQDAETQLRGLGVTVSNIHNAQLAIDVYCAAVTPGSRSTAMVVQECLGLSELVPAPSKHGRAMFATTWRNCQSFRCGGAKCEPLARSGLHTFINSVLSDFQERNSRNDLPIPPIRPQPHASVIPGEAPQRDVGRSVFYLLYIMTCVTVLVYWQCREHQYHLR